MSIFLSRFISLIPRLIIQNVLLPCLLDEELEELINSALRELCNGAVYEDFTITMILPALSTITLKFDRPSLVKMFRGIRQEYMNTVWSNKESKDILKGIMSIKSQREQSNWNKALTFQDWTTKVETKTQSRGVLKRQVQAAWMDAYNNLRMRKSSSKGFVESATQFNFRQIHEKICTPNRDDWIALDGVLRDMSFRQLCSSSMENKKPNNISLLNYEGGKEMAIKYQLSWTMSCIDKVKNEKDEKDLVSRIINVPSPTENKDHEKNAKRRSAAAEAVSRSQLSEEEIRANLIAKQAENMRKEAEIRKEKQRVALLAEKEKSRGAAAKKRK